MSSTSYLVFYFFFYLQYENNYAEEIEVNTV